MFEDGSFIIVIFMAIFSAGLIVFRVLEARTRPPKAGTRDYWIQQEIDQTMAWWDREFNRLSGTGEFAAVAEYSKIRANSISTDYIGRPQVGDIRVSDGRPYTWTGTAWTSERKHPREPVYSLTHMHNGEYVMEPVPVGVQYIGGDVIVR